MFLLFICSLFTAALNGLEQQLVVARCEVGEASAEVLDQVVVEVAVQPQSLRLLHHRVEGARLADQLQLALHLAVVDVEEEAVADVEQECPAPLRRQGCEALHQQLLGVALF